VINENIPKCRCYKVQQQQGKSEPSAIASSVPERLPRIWNYILAAQPRATYRITRLAKPRGFAGNTVYRLVALHIPPHLRKSIWFEISRTCLSKV